MGTLLLLYQPHIFAPFFIRTQLHIWISRRERQQRAPLRSKLPIVNIASQFARRKPQTASHKLQISNLNPQTSTFNLQPSNFQHQHRFRRQLSRRWNLQGNANVA